MRVTATARLRANGRGNRPSPLSISHTAAYSSHSFIAEPIWTGMPFARQYARGPALEESVSMLDSIFRDETERAHT